MSQVFERFLENSFREAMELVERSDALELMPLPPLPPSAYLCRFNVKYLSRQVEGTVAVADGPVVAAIHFPEDYLRSTDQQLYMKVASILTPDFIHPNVRGGVVCLGSSFAPGTPLKALLWELYDIATYQNCTLEERNAMNPEACRLIRQRPEIVSQLRPAPFVRRRRKFQIKVREQ